MYSMSLSVNIRKSLGNFRLDAAFEAENETLGLLGASGCGKSMTLKCIAGIEKPDEGRIVLDGRVLFDSDSRINLTPQQRHVGYLFQQYALFPNMTVAQNIAAGIRGKDRGQKREIAAAKIRALQLEGMQDHRPHELSGGQQQRVALARILVNDPALILLDEPFSALDSYLRWQMEMELADTLKAFGGTSVLVSHDRDEIYRNCSRVCVIDNGRSEPVTDVKTLFSNPVTMSAARLSGCKNYARVTSGGALNTLFIPAWNILLSCPHPLGESQYIGIRAHYLHAAAEGDVNRIPAVVLHATENVFSMILMLRVEGADEDAPLLRMELPKEEWRRIQSGRLIISIAPEDILLLK